MPHPPEVLRAAEDLNTHLPLRKGDRRLETTRYVIGMSEQPGPHATVVQRVRLQPREVEDTVAEVRAFMRREGRAEATWEIGPSATPHDLADRLRDLGMIPFWHAARTSSMIFSVDGDEVPEALREEPAVRIAPIGRDPARREANRAAFFRSQQLFWTCFDFHSETPGQAEHALVKEFEMYEAAPHWLRFVAWADASDREPLAVGDAALTPHGLVLCGGGTLPGHRGRGLYRALLAARLREAIARRTPRLLTQAGPMSQPILARLGFEEVASVEILHDRLAIERHLQ
jgi:GNAT superfamily N-acetyltransferase